MEYTIKPVMTIHSATLELSGQQLMYLANAQVHLQEVCDAYDNEFGSSEFGNAKRTVQCAALAPVAELLEACAALISGATMAEPAKRRGPDKRIAGDPTAAQRV